MVSPLDALVIPITLILVVTCGTLVGSLLPLLFARLGWDPALMSTPFVTVIVDILGIVVYMNVALLMLAELSNRACQKRRSWSGRDARSFDIWRCPVTAAVRGDLTPTRPAARARRTSAAPGSAL